MKALFVIVHEHEVEQESAYLASSIKAYREIQAIKEEEEFMVVNGDPNQIPANMPEPNEYKIYVCGARIDVCIPKQIKALQDVGYDVEPYNPASIY